MVGGSPLMLQALIVVWFAIASVLLLWFDAAQREYTRAYRSVWGVRIPLWDRGQRMHILFEQQSDPGLEGLRQRAHRRLVILIVVMIIVSIPLVVVRILT